MHVHAPKVLDWVLNEKHDFVPSLYGCTFCEEVFTSLPKDDIVYVPHGHTTYVDGCFACKVGTLELGTGDAGRADSPPQKKWDKELSNYRDARAQGVQPEGTSNRQIESALQASEKLGRAFNAETMGSAKTVTKEKAHLMNELGV
jgi:hypothetical protein